MCLAASMEKVAVALTDSSSLSTGDRVISIRYAGTINSHQVYSNDSVLPKISRNYCNNVEQLTVDAVVFLCSHIVDF